MIGNQGGLSHGQRRQRPVDQHGDEHRVDRGQKRLPERRPRLDEQLAVVAGRRAGAQEPRQVATKEPGERERAAAAAAADARRRRPGAGRRRAVGVVQVGVVQGGDAHEPHQAAGRRRQQQEAAREPFTRRRPAPGRDGPQPGRARPCPAGQAAAGQPVPGGGRPGRGRQEAVVFGATPRQEHRAQRHLSDSQRRNHFRSVSDPARYPPIARVLSALFLRLLV